MTINQSEIGTIQSFQFQVIFFLLQTETVIVAYAVYSRDLIWRFYQLTL
jgi:hypothetical protein